VTHKKYQLRRDHVRLQNQLESLLEEAHIKLSSLVSDLLGVSARRMLKALAEVETNPAALATLADQHLRATPEQLCDALGACTDLKPVYRRLPEDGAGAVAIPRAADEQLDQEMASLLSQPRISQAAGEVRFWCRFRTRSLPKSALPQRPFLREMPLLVVGACPATRRVRG